MKKLRLKLLILVLFIVLLSVPVFGSSMAAGHTLQQSELLWINPAHVTSYVGQSSVVALQLDDFSDVYGVQIDIAFELRMCLERLTLCKCFYSGIAVGAQQNADGHLQFFIEFVGKRQ